MADVRAYSPEQPRDEHGRWTETGGGSGEFLREGPRPKLPRTPHVDPMPNGSEFGLDDAQRKDVEDRQQKFPVRRMRTPELFDRRDAIIEQDRKTHVETGKTPPVNYELQQIERELDRRSKNNTMTRDERVRWWSEKDRIKDRMPWRTPDKMEKPGGDQVDDRSGGTRVGEAYRNRSNRG